MWKLSAILLAAATLSAQSPRYGVGRPPTPEEIRELGSAIAPDGSGLPGGAGAGAAGGGTGGRTRNAPSSAASQDGGELLAVRDDALGLRQSGHAIRSPGLARVAG